MLNVTYPSTYRVRWYLNNKLRITSVSVGPGYPLIDARVRGSRLLARAKIGDRLFLGGRDGLVEILTDEYYNVEDRSLYTLTEA